MQQTITVRPATEEDLPVLFRFEQGVITAERPFDQTLRAGDINYYDLPFMIEADHIHLLVAEIDGIIVGSGYARIEKARHYLDHKEYAYLGFMYTDPEYRGKGVNQKIIDTLKDWTLSRGLVEMRLEVYYQNEPAIRAYEKVGFAKLLIEMRKRIE